MESGCFTGQRKDHQSEKTDLWKIKPKGNMALKSLFNPFFYWKRHILYLNACFRNKVT